MLGIGLFSRTAHYVLLILVNSLFLLTQIMSMYMYGFGMYSVHQTNHVAFLSALFSSFRLCTLLFHFT